jgi:phage terminase small subunit
MGAPAQLRGHQVAEGVWRRAMRTYGELAKEIVTRLDQDLLIDYCLLMEQLSEMDQLRRSSVEIYQVMERARIEAAETDPALALSLGEKVLNAFDSILKLDARVDLKRSKLHTLRQSLYLTPRARAGTAPAAKEEEEAPDEMEKLLNDAGIFVATGKQDEGR